MLCPPIQLQPLNPNPNPDPVRGRWRGDRDQGRSPPPPSAPLTTLYTADRRHRRPYTHLSPTLSHHAPYTGAESLSVAQRGWLALSAVHAVRGRSSRQGAVGGGSVCRPPVTTVCPCWFLARVVDLVWKSRQLRFVRLSCFESPSTFHAHRYEVATLCSGARGATMYDLC